MTLEHLSHAAEQFLVVLATASQRTPRLGRKATVVAQL
jgi:hypothetical protein